MFKALAMPAPLWYPWVIILTREVPMHENRRFLRALLSRLIAERDDAEGLYIPRGEEGQRRMIRALLSMRPTKENDPLTEAIQRFNARNG